MNAPQEKAAAFDKKEADDIARSFNRTFGHAMMYGVRHQTTLDSVPPFFSVLSSTLASRPLITLTIEHDSVFIEGVNVDKLVNTKKLAAHFKKQGLQSISFQQGLTQKDLTEFLEVGVDTGRYPDAETFQKELERRKVSGIRLNYIVYRKMTADEEVIQKGAFGVTSPGDASLVVMPRPGTGGPGPSDALSLAGMLRNPRAAAGALFYTSSSGAPPPAGRVMAGVEKLGSQIRQAAAAGAVESGHLVEAVLALREECMGRVSDFKTAGLADKDTDAMVGEVEKLTRETVVYLVREEYRSGEVSARRLAQILRRMLPDRRELRTLLPELKAALIGDGMPFVKYIELVTELRQELEGDDVLARLSEATSDMGVAPDEVISEIQKHPADAARIMILLSELRRTGEAGTKGFEQLLVDYIEKTSRGLAVSEADAANPEAGRQIGSVLQKIEANLVENLKKQGVEQSVLTVLTARLAERLPSLLDETKVEWLKRALAACPELDTAMLAKLIAGTVQQAVDIDTHRDALYEACRQKGLAADQIQDVLHQAAAKVAAISQQTELPRGVLSSSAIMFFLERECKISQRYHNPFSLLVLSVLRLCDAKGVRRPPAAAERQLFTKALTVLLRGALRDIDLIGVPSSSAETLVFVVLPMTLESNTVTLEQRLRRGLSNHTFEVSGQPCSLDLAVSITGFDHKTMGDKTVFLKVAMARHREAEKALLSNVTEKT